MKIVRTGLLAGCFSLAAATTLMPFPYGARASAQTEASGQAAAHLLAETVDFEITDHINSKANAIGDVFHIRLVKPIVLDGQTVVPIGTPGAGEIIHVARARAGGKAGELILAVRYLDLGGQRIPLHAFRFGKGGESNVNEGLVVAIVAGPVAYLVVGGEVDVPSGSAGRAKIAGNVDLVRPSSGG